METVRPDFRVWNVFALLVAASLIAAAVEIPGAYLLHIQITPMLIAAQLLVALAMGVIGAGIGLWLGPPMGWGARELVAWMSRRDTRALLAPVPIAVLLGLVTGVLQTLAADQILTRLGLHLEPTPLLLGVLGGLAGSVREEIFYRLGLMTLFAWVGTRLLHRVEFRGAVAWAANGLAALLFAAQHLSSDAALLSHTVAYLPAITLAYHGFAGLVFGWLYWKRGLIAAIAGHFAADAMISVLNTLF